ncbi:(2Fe-2S)-binding protein [Cognatishimia sp. SS12]|uniref:(2Fe-2S)-binding protein n=1 Tax=Cognatishimia sp. SS12 TaxID=2979465 RepID=UPI003FA4600E
MTKPGQNNRRIAPRGGQPFKFFFEGNEVEAWPGESIGAALLAADQRFLRVSETDSPRGLLCGIGVCWECRCVIDGRPNTRSCVTPAAPGMIVKRQKGLK